MTHLSGLRVLSRSPRTRNLASAAVLRLVFGLLFLGRGVTSAAELPPVGPPLPAEPPAPITLSVADADNPLLLNATLDSKGQGTASRSIRILMSGAKTATLYMLASELQSNLGPGIYIDRGEVSIPAGTSLTGELAHNLRITVNNIPRPGQYSGKLTFFVLGQTRPALEMRVELEARARPEVVSARPTVTRQLVSCGTPLSCFLSSYVLSDGVVSDELLLQLENKTREPVKIVGSALILHGEHTNIEVAHDVLKPQPALPKTLPANQVTPLVLAVQRSHLPPDRYQGTLRLLVEGSDEPVAINLDLAVRHGPLLPLIVLLLGIGVGRLVQKMDAPDVHKQMKMMEHYQELAGGAALVTNPGAVQFVGRELTRVKALIESCKDSEETLQLAIDKANALVEMFFNIEQLERRAESVQASLGSQVLREAEAARKLLYEGNFLQAEEQRKQIEALLTHAQPSGEQVALPSFDGLHQLAVLQTAALAAADGAWRRAKATLSFLSGLSTRSADIRYWLMRPLLSVALLLLLSLLGLQQLYVNAGTTFGATGLYDYLGLFVWGLSADIAQRSLHSLPGTSSR